MWISRSGFATWRSLFLSLGISGFSDSQQSVSDPHTQSNHALFTYCSFYMALVGYRASEFIRNTIFFWLRLVTDDFLMLEPVKSKTHEFIFCIKQSRLSDANSKSEFSRNFLSSRIPDFQTQTEPACRSQSMFYKQSKPFRNFNVKLNVNLLCDANFEIWICDVTQFISILRDFRILRLSDPVSVRSHTLRPITMCYSASVTVPLGRYRWF